MPTDFDKDVPNPYEQYHDPKIGPQSILEAPARFIRENIVLKLRKKDTPVYYHRKFDRVPTIDQCPMDDYICRYEANSQYSRDKQVDAAKLRILKKRMTECFAYWGDSRREKCEKEREDFTTNTDNFFIKYGEIGRQDDVLAAYMKQKHRMIWVRRRQAQGDATASYTD